MATIPALHSRWRKKPPGCEVVTVERVWYMPLNGGWTVRAHPVRGGKPLVVDAHWFCTEGYEPATEPGE